MPFPENMWWGYCKHNIHLGFLQYVRPFVSVLLWTGFFFIFFFKYMSVYQCVSAVTFLWWLIIGEFVTLWANFRHVIMYFWKYMSHTEWAVMYCCMRQRSKYCMLTFSIICRSKTRYLPSILTTNVLCIYIVIIQLI